MVLEHEFIFRSEENALDMIKALKNADIPSKLQKSHQTEILLTIEGTYEGIKDFINKHIENLKKTQDDDCDCPHLSFEDIPEYQDFQLVLNNLESDYECLNNLLNGKKAGDIIIDNDESFEKTVKAFPSGNLPTIIANLYRSGTLELSEETIKLNNDYDQIEVPFTVIIPPYIRIEPEELEEFKILPKYSIIGAQTFKVTAGPEILFLENIEEIISCLVNDATDNEAILKLITDLTMNSYVADYVVSLLSKYPEKTIDELTIPDLNDITMDIPKGTVECHLSPEFFKGVIDDLKKMGIVKVKGNRVKHIKKLS